MKIKKKTGLLLAATATVAAVGVAAVSFAAWTGNNDTLSANTATGEAYLFGFTSDQSAANLELGTLVPYDQNDSTVKRGNKIVSVAIPEYTVYGDYTIAVTTTSSISFYALVGEEQTAVPEGAPETWADWKKVEADAATFTFTVTDPATVSDKYISLVMVSEDTADMNQSDIGFSVTLDTVTSA